ncbi:hypothetical protein D3C74_48990 [compost metagenome]
MGLDIEALKKKLVETQEKMKGSGGSGGDFSFWSPKDGRNVIRILPAKPGTADDFYAEARVHYNVGPNKKMVTCGKVARSSCAVCDFVDALFKSGDKEDEKLAKRMKATSRYYFNVIDRSVEEDSEDYGKVLVFGSGATIFTDILGIICDPDYGDITDADEGYDIIINKSGKGLDTEYKTNARPKQTPIGVEDWAEKLVDLSFFSKPKSDEDLEAILEGKDPKESKDEEASTSSSKGSKTSSKDEAESEEDIDGDADQDEIEREIAEVLKRSKK